MRGVLAALLVVLLLTGGCASVMESIKKTPERVDDVLQDPIRREHVVTQISLEWSTASVAMTCAVFVPFPFSLGVCPLLAVAYNFLAYEYVLDPISEDLVRQGKPSLVGPYWERGPKDGETFKCDFRREHCNRYPFSLPPVTE